MNPDNRYGVLKREVVDDGWGNLDGPLEPLVTTLTVDTSRTVISYNRSPDVGFDRSINPYRGCEHGCAYCFARPTHAYLDLSPGLDFESRLSYKPEAPELLRKELGARSYRPAPMAVGINTDAYQPIERRLELTRRILEVLVETRHPFTIVTKSSLIERDLDLLARAAERGLTSVWMSFSTLRRDLARRLEPRAAAPQRRIETLGRIAAAGVPVGILAAPVIPALTDDELDTLFSEARAAGATFAGYALLRLPRELKQLFCDWLDKHAPLKARRVMSLIRESRGGKDYEAEFGTRMVGVGEYAAMIGQRFRLAHRRLRFGEAPALDCAQFVKPGDESQLSLL
jgi:DNA repair photolyase